jgi:hypothetical protein
MCVLYATLQNICTDILSQETPQDTGHNGRSGFKFHTVAMSLAQQFFVENLLNALLLLFPDVFSLPVTIPVVPMTFAKFLYLDVYILIPFHPRYVLHSYPTVLLHLPIANFICPIFNYYVWHIGQTLSICLHPLIPQYCYILMFTYLLRYM